VCYTIVSFVSVSAIFLHIVLLTAVTMCVLSSVLRFSEIFLIPRKTERDFVINVHTYAGFHVQYPSLLSGFNET